LVNANLFMFVYACMYVLGLMNNEKCKCTYVPYVQEQNWWRQTDRQTDSNKAQGIVPHLFSFKGAVWKKQNHSFQSYVWVKIKIYFLFWYSFEKCCKYAIVINKERNQFSFCSMHQEKAPVK